MITKPKGCYDVIDKDALKLKKINRYIDYYCEFYNYDLIRTPIFESRDLFHRTVGTDTEILRKKNDDFKERVDRQFTLRHEVTLGVVCAFS